VRYVAERHDHFCSSDGACRIVREHEQRCFLSWTRVDELQCDGLVGSKRCNERAVPKGVPLRDLVTANNNLKV
jgi:hypothetical protein